MIPRWKSKEQWLGWLRIKSRERGFTKNGVENNHRIHVELFPWHLPRSNSTSCSSLSCRQTTQLWMETIQHLVRWQVEWTLSIRICKRRNPNRFKWNHPCFRATGHWVHHNDWRYIVMLLNDLRQVISCRSLFRHVVYIVIREEWCYTSCWRSFAFTRSGRMSCWKCSFRSLLRPYVLSPVGAKHPVQIVFPLDASSGFVMLTHDEAARSCWYLSSNWAYYTFHIHNASLEESHFSTLLEKVLVKIRFYC